MSIRAWLAVRAEPTPDESAISAASDTFLEYFRSAGAGDYLDDATLPSHTSPKRRRGNM